MRNQSFMPCTFPPFFGPARARRHEQNFPVYHAEADGNAMTGIHVFLRRLRTGISGTALTLIAIFALGHNLARAQAPSPAQSGQPSLSPHAAPNLPIDSYISDAWSTLRRSMLDCTTLVDPKVTTRPVLYLPNDFAEPPEVAAIKQKCGVSVQRLPVKIEHLGQNVDLPSQGLLYLPHPYVVPGGRFNEMYGWDSYFIILGLLESGHADLARDMVENFYFEIEHYGGLLNANRTYYLTRSQPPFLSSEIRDVWQADIVSGKKQEAQAWLERGYTFAVRDHALWTSEAHRAGSTGLARYFDYGNGPVAEMADDDTYYQNVISWLLAHPGVDTDYLVNGPANPGAADRPKIAEISCDPEVSAVCARAHVGTHWLSKDFYKGDRAMRESGFDPSFRFGVFDGSTHHYAPVCLNSLLYKYERDLAWMARQLGKPDEAGKWDTVAEARRAAMDRYLWNPEKGRYFDYDFVAAKQSTYEYVTTFYPLWAGAATPQQAHQVESHLNLFEKPGGLAMSTRDTGVQWDLPYGWAPAMWIAVAGLQQQGDLQDAARVSREFMTTVRNNYAHDRTIREKYNVVTGSSDVQVATGYRQNVVGFGWTNAAYLKMEELLRNAGTSQTKGTATAGSLSH
jgi:alpha,alpha-trehalase